MALTHKIPHQALKFARRGDLLCRGVFYFNKTDFAALFVERTGKRWAIYYKQGAARSHRVYFPSEDKAKTVWRQLVAGEVSSVVYQARIPNKSEKERGSLAEVEVGTELGRWFVEYLNHSGYTEAKILEANRMIKLLSQQGMDILAKEWWEANIPERGFAKTLHVKSKEIVTVVTRPINRRQRMTRAYIAKRLRLLTQVINFAGVMGDGDYPTKNFHRLADGIKLHYKASKASDYEPINNYQPLGAKDLDTVLREIAKRGLGYYLFTVLGLSTLIRYKDLRGIRKEFLGADDRLIYNKQVSGTYLSKKTVESGKVDASRLANPTASLVTRVILRHMKWKPFDGKLEREIFRTGSEVREKLSPFGAENCVVRAIRTTGATLLVESGNSDGCRKITAKEVVERLGHVDNTMLNTIYARIRPPEMGTENIDEYLDLPDIVIGGVLINGNESAFDCWLVNHMLETYKGRKEEEFLKSALIAEIKPLKVATGKKKVSV